MIVPKRKHFHYYDDYYHGSGIFDNIISKVSSAVTSSAAKEIGRKSLEGIAKGAQKGSEDAARLLIKNTINKMTSPKKEVPAMTSKKEVPAMTPTNIKNNHETIDERTRMLLTALKHGSGIKTII